MTCNDIQELLAAYALDALEGADDIAVREHLSTCRQHDDDLAELQSVTARLPFAAEEREPSPALRGRVLAAADAGTPSPHTAQQTSRVVPFVRRRSVAWLAAAALLVAVVGLGIWNVVLQTDNGESGGGWTVSADLTGSGVDGHFWYLDKQQLAVVSMDEMPRLESGHVYQAWGIYDGKPVSLGVMPDEANIAMKVDLGGATLFAITEEPAGGSDQPTSEPIASADLT